MRTRTISILLAAFLFLSCLTAAVLHYGGNKSPSDNTQQLTEQTDTSVLVFKNLKYGQHENQTFDLNLPVDNRDGIGLVLFLHGGGWIGGDKTSVRNSYSVFNANREYATASINYRFINDGVSDINDIIDDITLALSHIRRFASDYSVNLTKVILCGHSAGGHLSLLYAYKYKDISPIEPVGVFASAPVPDLSLDTFYTDNTLGDETHMCNLISQLCAEKFTPATRASKKALLDEISPLSYVSSASVPTVILHGSKDRIAPFSGSLVLSDKLSEYSVDHELVIFENSGHSMKNNEETKAYASELMLSCAREWFNITN